MADRPRPSAVNTLLNLRRTTTPYVGQSMILVGVTILLLCVALKKQQWDLLWGAGLVWALYGSYVFLFGMKYRVSCDEEGVNMKASGGPARSIRFEDINEVCYETARAHEYLSQARPFRRIVIHGRPHDPNGRIDVSLRHFRSKDIDELLKTIRERRPDLTLPAGWPTL